MPRPARPPAGSRTNRFGEPGADGRTHRTAGRGFGEGHILVCACARALYFVGVAFLSTAALRRGILPDPEQQPSPKPFRVVVRSAGSASWFARSGGIPPRPGTISRGASSWRRGGLASGGTGDRHMGCAPQDATCGPHHLCAGETLAICRRRAVGWCSGSAWAVPAL